MADSDEIKTARRVLGRQDADLLKAAGHTQHGFARLVQYGRSSVANTETGHQHPDVAFWVRCDTVLQSGGVLATEYDRSSSWTAGVGGHR
ncbi:helix-turn-helix domain-containing protein [Micromonospora globbae]|uniref:helix-turn-helix domain-containing protein n=1 Tax=Micromonospora globbae TaxID=1894969 RepID=UPI001F01BFA8|nr:helix-turn-helix transcriptional regulator [Micromonospora globbae]